MRHSELNSHSQVKTPLPSTTTYTLPLSIFLLPSPPEPSPHYTHTHTHNTHPKVDKPTTARYDSIKKFLIIFKLLQMNYLK